MKLRFKLCLFIVVNFSTFSIAQNDNETLKPLSFEHLHINVADNKATAQWYVDNVGLEIVSSDNKDEIYVADKDHNFMLELSSVSGIRNNYFDINIDAFHLAFEGHKTIEKVAEKILANGGTPEGSIYRNKIGDYVMNVRDPNGFSSQLIYRVNPFFPKPIKSTIRFEHFAYNIPDQKQEALWYVEFMDLKIPWSKDIDTTQNNFRNYRVPYVGDVGKNMSFELFGKKIESSLMNMPHSVIHIAFNCANPQKIAARMILGGARQVGEMRLEKNGDKIIDLYNSNNIPIRLIKREKDVLINIPK